MDNENKSISFERLMASAEEALSILKGLFEENIGKDTWVVASDYYVNVGSELGLNGTDYYPRSLFISNNAQIFPSELEAERFGVDYFLQNGKGERIIPKPILAEKFFREELNSASLLIEYLRGLEKK